MYKTPFFTLMLTFLILSCNDSQVKENEINTQNMKSLKIVRKFDVMPEKVFAIFTKPKDMVVWWTEDTQFSIDLKVGGKYSIMRKEGDAIYNMTGEYLELHQPNKLKYTCAMLDFSPIIDTISIEIQPDGKGGSILTFIQEGEGIDSELKELPENTVSESEKGWKMGFDLMESHWGKL